MTKFAWLDSYDLFLIGKKIAALRKQFAEREWVRFSFSDEGCLSRLEKDVGLASMFHEGKVVYSYDTPYSLAGVDHRTADKMAKKVADLIQYIPDGTLLLLLAPIESGELLDAAENPKLLGTTIKIDKIDKTDRLNMKSAVDWAIARAEQLKVGMEMEAAKRLVNSIGCDPNDLTMEIIKLGHVSNPITVWVVDQGCYGTGESDDNKLSDYILDGNGEMAHDFLNRTIAKGRKTQEIMAFLSSWTHRLSLAESCGGDLDDNWGKTPTREKLSELTITKQKKDDEGNPKISPDGKPELDIRKMFPKLGAMYWACQNFKKAGRLEGWTYEAYETTCCYNEKLKGLLAEDKDEASVVLHRLLDELLTIGRVLDA